MIARSKTTKEHKALTIIRNSMQCVSIHKMLQREFNKQVQIYLISS